MRYENIPYRVWRKRHKSAPFELVETAIYPRVMKRVGEALKAGKAVELDNNIVHAEPVLNKPYDTITVTITP